MKKFTVAMGICALLLCALPLSILAEGTAFELGHMEGTTYVNTEMGIAFDASGFSDMAQTFTGDALDEANKCAWNDAKALQAKLDAGESLVCFAFGDASKHTPGVVNMIKITVQNATKSAKGPEVALLEKGKAELKKQAKKNGYKMDQAEIGEMDFAGATRPCLSVDFESGGRHKQQLYVTVLAGERVYRVCFDMDASEVPNYMDHFSVQ